MKGDKLRCTSRATCCDYFLFSVDERQELHVWAMLLLLLVFFALHTPTFLS